MKQCPQCNDMILYDDVQDICPICSACLYPYIKIESVGQSGQGDIAGKSVLQQHSTAKKPQIIRPNRSALKVEHPEGEMPQFMQRVGRKYVFRGTVAEVSSQTRYYSRFHKIVNTCFHGEPYQFGNTSHESVIRVEEFHDGRLASKRRDMIVYGDIEGLVQVGDDVTVWTRSCGGRHVVQRLYSNETDSYVMAGPQMPAWVVVTLVSLSILLLVGLISSVISFVRSGGLLQVISILIGFLLGIVMQFLPQLLIIGGIFWILKLFLIGR